MKPPYVAKVWWYASGTYWQLKHGAGKILGTVCLRKGRGEKDNVFTVAYSHDLRELRHLAHKLSELQRLPIETANTAELYNKACELYDRRQPLDLIFTKIRKSSELVGLLNNRVIKDMIDPAVRPLVKMRVEMVAGKLVSFDRASEKCQMTLLSDGECHYELRHGIKAVTLHGSNLSKVRATVGDCVMEFRQNL